MNTLSRLTPAPLLLLACACDANPSSATDGADIEPAQDVELADDAGERVDRMPDGVDLAVPRDPFATTADCCATGPDTCSDLVVAECVCVSDSYCCDVEWDSLCVSEVDSLGCGTCAEEVACCAASPLPGCEDSSTASCVCDADPYCCGNQWDSICVSEVESLGCGSCDPVDLVITEIMKPAQACVGQDIGSLVSLDVTNDSSDAISETFGVAWYLSEDPFWGTGDSLLLGGRDQISGGMAGGSTVSVSSDANQIPWTATPGPQYLLAVVDEFDAVSERDEVNNVLARPIDITGTCVSATGWLKRLGGTEHDSVFSSTTVAIDTQGNVYVSGRTLGPTIDLGQGPEPTQREDGFIVGYDPDGNYRWSRLFSGAGDDTAYGVAIDSADRVYVVLGSTGPLDTGMGETPVTGRRDLLVAAYHHDGSPRWTNRYGAPDATLGGSALAANATGELVAVGRIGGLGVDFGGGALPGTMPFGFSDAFVLSLDSAGTYRFSRQLEGPFYDSPRGVDINAAGEVLVVGSFGGTVDYGAGPLTSAGANDGFVLKLDAAGDSLWSDSFGGTQQDGAGGAFLDDSGVAYVTGTVDGTANVGGSTLTTWGFDDTIVLAYGGSGAPLWVRHGGGTWRDGAGGLTMNAAGELVVTAMFNTGFGESTNAYFAGQTLTSGSTAGQHLVLAGYRPVDGAGLWAELYEASSSGTDAIGGAFGESVAASPAGNVVVAGRFHRTLSAQGSTVTAANEPDSDHPDVFILSTTP